MPLLKINADGTVKISNKKTGEVKDVKPEDLAKYSPKLVTKYYEMTQSEDSGINKSTQLAIDTLKSEISAAQEKNPDENTRGVIYRFIKDNEGIFKNEGVDINRLWAMHNDTPEKTIAQQDAAASAAQTPTQSDGGILGRLFGGGQPTPPEFNSDQPTRPSFMPSVSVEQPQQTVPKNWQRYQGHSPLNDFFMKWRQK